MCHGLIAINNLFSIESRAPKDFSPDSGRKAVGGCQLNRQNCQVTVGLRSVLVWRTDCLLECITAVARYPAEGCSKSLSLALGTICLNNVPSPPHIFLWRVSHRWQWHANHTLPQVAAKVPHLVLRCQERSSRVMVLRSFCVAPNPCFQTWATQMETIAIGPSKSGWGLLLDNTPKKENDTPETNRQNRETNVSTHCKCYY